VRLDKKIALRAPVLQAGPPAEDPLARRSKAVTKCCKQAFEPRAASLGFCPAKLLNPRTRGFASIIVSMRSLADSLCCAASNLPMENHGGEVRA
jgi:hypothetical protein